MKEMLRNLLSNVEMRDAFFFGGLILAGMGFWMLRPWLALIIVGGILIAVSLKPGKGTEAKK